VFVPSKEKVASRYVQLFRYNTLDRERERERDRETERERQTDRQRDRNVVTMLYMLVHVDT